MLQSTGEFCFRFIDGIPRTPEFFAACYIIAIIFASIVIIRDAKQIRMLPFYGLIVFISPLIGIFFWIIFCVAIIPGIIIGIFVTPVLLISKKQ